MTLQWITSDVLKGNINLPSSKSISNRVLMIQALCDTQFEIQNLSEAHDTILLKKQLTAISVTTNKITIDIEDAGTPFRFLTAYLSMQEGKEFIITGSERLCERPIHQLTEALQHIGADITYLNKTGFAPLLIKGKELNGTIKITGNISSQFISALCLIAPCLKDDLTIEILNEKVSDSYILMTLNIMKTFGIHYSYQNNMIQISHQTYQAQPYEIENDWSSATFFYAMAMLHNNVEIKLHGLTNDSLQGDAFIKVIASDFGIITTFEGDDCIIKKVETIYPSLNTEYNLSSYPDLAIPVVVACAIQYPWVRITGIHHLELKESSRITALQNELSKINIHLLYQNEVLSFNNESDSNTTKEISFQTYNDHRIAMALSMLTLKGYEVTLDNSDCVKKSFPDYFEELKKLGIVHSGI